MRIVLASATCALLLAAVPARAQLLRPHSSSLPCSSRLATRRYLLKDSAGGDVIVESALSGGARFAGLGAAVAIGIHALVRRRQVIYRKPAGRPSALVS